MAIALTKVDRGMAITDKNRRWAPRGQRKCLNQVLTSQGKGSGSLMSSALKARAAEWRGMGRRGQWERRKERQGGTSFGASGPLSRLGGSPRHSLAPLEGSEDCRTSVHSCMVLCRAWVFSLST